MENNFDLETFLNNVKLKAAFGIYRALNHPLRKNILKVIAERGQPTTTDIQVALRLVQSVASIQIGILKKAGIIKQRRKGRFIHHVLAVEYLQVITEATRILTGNEIAFTPKK